MDELVSQVWEQDVDFAIRKVKQINFRAWKKFGKEKQITLIKIGRWLEATRLDIVDYPTKSRLIKCVVCGQDSFVRFKHRICHKCQHKLYKPLRIA